MQILLITEIADAFFETLVGVFWNSAPLLLHLYSFLPSVFIVTFNANTGRTTAISHCLISPNCNY